MKSFFVQFSVYSCHLFLISSTSVRSIPFLSFIEPIFCMKCSLGISKFLEGISSLSHFIVFLFFFTLITEEGFLICLCYFLELCFQLRISFLFSFASLLFTAIFKASSDSHFPFLNLVFLGMVLIPVSCTVLWTSIHSSSGTLSDLTPWIYFSLPLCNHKGFDLGHTWMI